MKILSSLSTLLLFVPCLTVAKPQEMKLKELKFSTERTAQLCDLLPQSCQNKDAEYLTWTLYQSSANEFYLIDDLKFYQLNVTNSKFQILQQWDFSNYQPSTQKARWVMYDRNDSNKRLSIFPKLFPINEQDYAVGIVQAWQEGYSGGGMEEEVVDFLQLKTKGQYQQVFQNIPLSMYRMIRACFTDEDTQKSREKCHDEYTLDTQIRYVKPYTWQVKYHYQADYSPVSDSGSKPVNLWKNYLLKDNRADAIQLPKAWD